MIIIGQALQEPEVGWRRIEDSNTNILYEGAWSSQSNSAYSGGSRHFCSNTSENSKVKFNFVGSKFLIISSLYTTYSDKIEVKIDGEVVDYYSLATKDLNKAVAYIKEGLEFREYSIELTKINKGAYSSDFNLDAIDIDANGEIKPFRVLKSKFLISTEDNNTYSLVPSETIDLVPKMTSNTAPSGTVFGSNYSYNNYLWYAFNKGGDSTYWQSPTYNITNQHIGYTFTSAQIVNKYSIQSSGGYAPRSWRFEASNDRVSWIVLDSQENQTNWISSESKAFLIDNDVPYLSYRIFVLNNNNDKNWIRINSIYFYQVTEEELIKIDTLNEKSFVHYGLEPKEALDIHKNISKINYINFTNEMVGSGKVFKQSIKNKVKNATIK